MLKKVSKWKYPRKDLSDLRDLSGELSKSAPIFIRCLSDLGCV